VKPELSPGHVVSGAQLAFRHAPRVVSFRASDVVARRRIATDVDALSVLASRNLVVAMTRRSTPPEYVIIRTLQYAALGSGDRHLRDIGRMLECRVAPIDAQVIANPRRRTGCANSGTRSASRNEPRVAHLRNTTAPRRRGDAAAMTS